MFLDYGLLRMALASKLTSSFVIFLVLSVALLPLMHIGYAQTTSSVNFSTKGTVAESSNFHGVVMWTIVHGDKGTILIQSPVGRGLVHVSISPSTACDSSTPICLLSTVIDTTDNDVFKVGDTARYSIDLNTKQETVSLLTGVLAGFDVTVNLSKTWEKTPTISSTTTAITNSTAPKNFTLSLNESVGITAKG